MATAAEYEAAVMRGDPDPPEPPEDYVMSEAFRNWLVGRMRDEVFGEDGGMAILTTKGTSEEE